MVQWWRIRDLRRGEARLGVAGLGKGTNGA